MTCACCSTYYSSTRLAFTHIAKRQLVKGFSATRVVLVRLLEATKTRATQSAELNRQKIGGEIPLLSKGLELPCFDGQFVF